MRDDRKVDNTSLRVGEWKFGTDDNYVAITTTVKPNWLQRLIVKLLTRTTWREYDEPQYKPTLIVKEKKRIK